MLQRSITPINKIKPLTKKDIQDTKVEGEIWLRKRAIELEMDKKMREEIHHHVQAEKERLELEKEAQNKKDLREQKMHAEKEEAYRWYISRPPDSAPILDCNIIDEYKWHVEKTANISKIIKLHPSYSHEEVESIIYYLYSQRHTQYKYSKNTLLAMKALNRFARENEIDINSAFIVWNEYV